jgi:hypothetical protein
MAGINEKIRQEKLEYLDLKQFIELLKLSEQGEDNPLSVLFDVLDEGLLLRYAEIGNVYDNEFPHKGDVKCALIKSKKTDKEIIIKTEGGLDISVGNLLVKRSDFKKIYLQKYNPKHYPWASISNEQGLVKWSWFPDIDIETNAINQSIEAVSPALDSADPKSERLRFCPLEKLSRQWSKLFKETITETDILHMALDQKLNVYVYSNGVRNVMLRSMRVNLGHKSPLAIPAYIDEQFIRLEEHHVRPLLYGKSTEIIFLKLNEIDLIQGDVPFDLSKINSEVEAVILDQGQRISISQDDIKYLSVSAVDVPALEERLQTSEESVDGNNENQTAIGNDVIATRKQIELIFNKLDPNQWRGNFGREKNNGLDKARIGEKGDATYSVSEVSKWLKRKGHYTEAEIKAAIDKYNGAVQENGITPKAKVPNNCTVANLALRQLEK